MRAAILLLLIALPVAADAQIVRGRLMDRDSRTPLAGGTVHLVSEDSQVVVAQGLTDGAGVFDLQAPAPGSYSLAGVAPGYAPASTDPFDVSEEGRLVSFVIGRAAVRLDSVVVRTNSDAHGGFHARMRERGGSGRFFSREDIQELRPQTVADLLRRVSGLEVIATGGQTLAVRPRQALSIRSGCWSNFYLNGMRVEADAIAGLNPENIEGVEVYTHGSVPPQLGAMGSACGVVAVWLRTQ
ncbi:MAG TPA: carboxypeptidase regulatory-like domain-containing protein [Longimicrobium sp.]|nr:carboxypeptidase regulatory-like domain-containing protein [Longimicrobium sp.]